jgi:hypothetical protein
MDLEGGDPRLFDNAINIRYLPLQSKKHNKNLQLNSRDFVRDSNQVPIRNTAVVKPNCPVIIIIIIIIEKRSRFFVNTLLVTFQILIYIYEVM